MNRREYVAAALLGATAGWLRLESGGETSSSATSQSTDAAATTVDDALVAAMNGLRGLDVARE